MREEGRGRGGGGGKAGLDNYIMAEWLSCPTVYIMYMLGLQQIFFCTGMLHAQMLSESHKTQVPCGTLALIISIQYILM